MSASSYIRKWAREQGYDVNERGRVPAEIVEAFENRTEVTAPEPEVSREDFKPSSRKSKGQMCGFCGTGHHKLCPGSIRNGANAPNPIWYCQCTDPSHS